MKKLFVVFATLAALIFVISCGGSKKESGGESSDICSYGEYECLDGVSYFCTYQGDELGWIFSKECSNGCDERTGKCRGGADSEPSDTEHENPDTDSGDSTTDGADTTPDNDTDTTPDNDTDTDSGDSAPDQDNDADTGAPSMEEGIYLGIIGFNDDLTKMPIKRLTDANKQEFKNFISSLPQLNYTALYWADYSALEMMRNYAISPDLQLKKVALVTFTDGLDNQSLSFDEFNPGNYDSQTDYRDAIHDMIMDEEGIHGQPVTAYSIGLKGSDVTDEAKFRETLEKLATEENGEEKFVFQVTDMSEVEDHFAAIADSLYKVSTTINVGVYIPGGYDNGQVIRYTFDNVSAATNSNLYIEATYRRSGSTRTLENIKYEGFMQGASTISSTATGPHGELYFQFNDLKYSDGTTVSQSEIMSKSRLWKQTSSGGWDGESEMNMAELPPVIDEDKSSALIMLVLDATTSLGSDFSRMQNAARNFVETLVNGGSSVTETSPCDNNPCATVANSTHVCTVSGSNYVCGCNSGYNWNGSQCTTSSTPCNPNPCTSIENSNGNCTVSGSSYTCGCYSGYTWSGGSCTSGGGSSLPECSSTSATPCYDSTSHLTWSARASSAYTWANAGTYCDNLTEGGYSDWHLPTIDELKTLLTSATGGTPRSANCAVSETNGCLAFDGCWTCSTCTEQGTASTSSNTCSNWGTSYSDGRYSKFGETGFLWSSSTRSDSTDSIDRAWGVDFSYGRLSSGHKTDKFYVRCVR